MKIDLREKEYKFCPICTSKLERKLIEGKGVFLAQNANLFFGTIPDHV